MDTPGIIYRATNTRLTENNVYIGKTWRGLPDRIKQHISATKSGSDFKFHKSLMDNNFQNFSWEIIDTFLTEEEGKEKEDMYIKKYNAIGSSYNTGPSAAGRPKKYLTEDEVRQAKRDKALRWYYKSKTKSPEPEHEEEVTEIVEVSMDEDDVMDNRASIIKSVINGKMKEVLRKKLSR